MKILSFPVDDGGCGNYRVRQPLEMIRRFTDSDAHVIDHAHDSMPMVAQAMAAADILIARPGSEPGVRQILSMKEFKGKPWVMDIDDNTEIVSPYSEHFSELGTYEYFDKARNQWLWKDGVGGFDLKHNREKLNWLKWGLTNANLVTVTTQRLADYASVYNNHVAVLPNCIDLERWWQLPFRPNKRLRVGWGGGISHYEDWYAIKEPLNRLMRQYQFTLVMVGAQFPGLIDKDLQHLVELHSWQPFASHSFHMMAMNLDVGIIPLADLPFNYFKSSVKWYEMAAMGVPCLVSQIPPYSEDPDDEGSKIFYHDDITFGEGLNRLLQGATERRQLAAKAKKWVEAHRNAKTSAQLWLDAYSSVL